MHAFSEHQLVNKILSSTLRKPISVDKIEPVGGGSISNTFKISTSTGNYFLKTSNEKNAMLMFEKEIEGLELIRGKSRFTIPEIIALTTEGVTTYLILEYIESSNPKLNYWQKLAEKLAELHQNSAAQFGLKENNFIGSLPQVNCYEDEWAIFFINQRIEPMIKLATSRNLLNNRIEREIEQVLKEVTNLMPIESPSLLHGDLWSGNLIPDTNGNPCLIDPAVYYGHREIEIAFTQLFGGFSQGFYDRYLEVYPLEPGFEERVDLYNLYPLLVHLNLFGKSYLPQIERIIKRFT